MTPKEYKKKRGESGTILNTFDVEKPAEYMKIADLFEASYKMIIGAKAPGNVYPVTKRKAKDLISKKVMEEQFETAKKKVDAREEKAGENDV